MREMLEGADEVWLTAEKLSERFAVARVGFAGMVSCCHGNGRFDVARRAVGIRPLTEIKEGN